MTAKHGIIATKRETVEGGIMKVWYEQTEKDTGWQQLEKRFGFFLWLWSMVMYSSLFPTLQKY